LSERAPYRKKKEGNCHSNKLKSGHLSKKGPDIKTKWPTDRRSQLYCNFNFEASNTRPHYSGVNERREEDNIGQTEMRRRIQKDTRGKYSGKENINEMTREENNESLNIKL
jgi:hypothetical protein